MAHNERERARLRALCGELHDDDGVDPREFFRPIRKRDKASRKSQQLCRQVQKTLDLVFSGETHDELLAALRIVSVTSSADSCALVVTLVADILTEQFNRDEIEARLAAMSGRLRSEVAATITRKRTPLLVFHLLGPQGDIPAVPGLSTDPAEDSP